MEQRKDPADHDESDGKHCEATSKGADRRRHHGDDEGHLHGRYTPTRRTQLQRNAKEQRPGYDCVYRDVNVMNAPVA
jgi:hypothetical protein